MEETKTIRFKATAGFKSYHDRPDWRDGDTRPIEAATAKTLVESFPDNFEYVDPKPVVEPEKTVDAAESNKSMDAPDSDKLIKPKKSAKGFGRKDK